MSTINNKNKQALKTKNKIYKACLKVINNYGYEHINVKEICKICDVSIGCFYHHFKSKEGILTEYFNNVELQLIKDIKKVKKYDDKHTLEKILIILEQHISIISNIGVNILTEYYKAQISVNGIALFSESRILPNMLKEIFKTGYERGEVTEYYETDFMINEILCFTRSLLYDWCIHKGDYDIIPEAKTSLQLFLSNFDKNSHKIGNIVS